MINYHIKGLHKTTLKKKSNFSQCFFSHWMLYKCFFSFLIKAFANFEKLIRFNWQAFIVYKNGENLEILIQIFCQKLIVPDVVLPFLDCLKPKIFFFGKPWWPIWSTLPPFSKSLDPSLKFFKFLIWILKQMVNSSSNFSSFFNVITHNFSVNF